jgi:lysophospholipase L1-like esterase
MRFITIISVLLWSCQHDPIPPPLPDPLPVPAESVDLLCLGDSYTKGESVVWAQNFPNQLTDSLRSWGWQVPADAPRIIAQTGWRTDQLKTAIASATELADSTFGLVTLCIGVNNQYQNANMATYMTEFEQLLQTAIERTGGRPERVFVLSIPDWAYTPFGQNFPGEPNLISDKLDQYNLINKAYAAQYGTQYIEVTSISRTALARPELNANDGLHPSAIQYTEWVQKMLPVVRTVVK